MEEEKKKKPEVTEEVKKKWEEHRQLYQMSREPLLTGLSSEYDLKLFREAQALAAEQVVSVRIDRVIVAESVSSYLWKLDSVVDILVKPVSKILC